MRKWWWIILVLMMVGLFIYFQNKPRPKILNSRIENSEDKIEKKKEFFKIAIMADVHNDIESLQKAYEMAKDNGVGVIFLAGDLTINGTKTEIDKINEETKSWVIKNYSVPGNHDLYKKAWVGSGYQSVKISDLKFILINNANWRGLGGDQKKWLEAELPECLVIKCVAVMHMPLLNNFSKHVMGEHSTDTLAEAGWLKNILMLNNVRTGYSGHLHYSSSYTIDGWETVLVGAISKERNTQTPRFTEVEIGEDGTMVNKVIQL